MLENDKFYLSAYRKFGVSPEGLNWNSKKTQELRFAVLTSFLDQELASCKVVDFGCGFGDLPLYWHNRNLKVKEYVGIDSIGKFVKIAKKRTDFLKNTTFYKRDVLSEELVFGDWGVASGSLNILSEFDSWFFIERMLEYSEKGVVFNILKGEKKSENFNYKTKEEMEEYLISKDLKFEIEEGYLPDDMSVKVYK